MASIYLKKLKKEFNKVRRLRPIMIKKIIDKTPGWKYSPNQPKIKNQIKANSLYFVWDIVYSTKISLMVQVTYKSAHINLL